MSAPETERLADIVRPVSLRTVTLCEETGVLADPGGRCSVHGGDACLYVYRHPYDDEWNRWKRKAQWGVYPAYDPTASSGSISTGPQCDAQQDGLSCMLPTGHAGPHKDPHEYEPLDGPGSADG